MRHRRNYSTRTFISRHLGPSYGKEEILTAIQVAKCTTFATYDEDALLEATADAIIHGEIVGWFQGAVEWGSPRPRGAEFPTNGEPARSSKVLPLTTKVERDDRRAGGREHVVQYHG